MSDILPLPSKYHCPACQREIYLRRRATCEFCGEALPESVRLSPEELAAIDKEMEEMRARRERDRKKEEERKRKRSSDDGGAYVAF
jgi:hypothetical protein